MNYTIEKQAEIQRDLKLYSNEELKAAKTALSGQKDKAIQADLVNNEIKRRGFG